MYPIIQLSKLIISLFSSKLTTLFRNQIDWIVKTTKRIKYEIVSDSLQIRNSLFYHKWGSEVLVST